MVTRAPLSPSDTEPSAREQKRAARSSSASGDAGEQSHGDTWRGLQAAWHRIQRGIPELKDDLTCYATAQADRARFAVSRALTSVVRAIAIGVVAIAVVVAAAVLTIDGIAGGLAEALDGRVWLANLITGVGIAALLLAAAALRSRAGRNARLRRLAQRYARHDARQRDVEQRAMEGRGAAS